MATQSTLAIGRSGPICGYSRHPFKILDSIINHCDGFLKAISFKGREISMPSTIPLPFNLSAYGGFVVSGASWGDAPLHLAPGANGTPSGRTYYSTDFSLKLGTAVTALANGTVVDLDEHFDPGVKGASGFGNFITVYYPSLGLYATYAHLTQNSIGPAINATVVAGQTLGTVGNAGYGIHLHFQLGTTLYGSTTQAGGNGLFANGLPSLGVPAYYDTATGQLLAGVISSISYDLTASFTNNTGTYSSASYASNQHNISLTGLNNVNASGDSLANTLSGNRGDNVLDGRGGNDNLYGGSGNDILVGGAGDDFLEGGLGRDSANYSTSTAPVNVSLVLQNTWQFTGGAGYDFLRNIEDLTGSSFNDRLTGDSGANQIYGLGGNDTLTGGGGSDTLNGGIGNDILTGGLGRDTLTGGANSDIFVYSNINETGVGSGSRDVITDLSPGDIIDLSAIDANSLLLGNQAFSIVGNSAAALLPGTLWLSNGILYGNVNGGAADFEIQLNNVYTLPAGSILA